MHNIYIYIYNNIYVYITSRRMAATMTVNSNTGAEPTTVLMTTDVLM